MRKSDRMNEAWSVWASLGVIALAAAACGLSPAPQLAEGDNEIAVLPLSLDLLAGHIGGPGNANGAGAAARFNFPTGAAVDGAGNVYVADEINHTIRKITAAGVVTTLAGAAGVPGSADGTGAAARFDRPFGVAVDGTGNVYVADQLNDTIRKVTAAGVVTTLAGAAGVAGSADGAGAAARFNAPTGVAVDAAGNVYVADHFNSVIRKITAAGVVTTLAGAAGVLGSADGTGAAARFAFPFGVAVDRAGTVYVADTSNATVRKVSAAGVVTTLAGTAGMIGSTDGAGAAARFNAPFGVAADRAGNVYVADANNSTVRKVTAAGVVTTLAGTAGMTGAADGTGSAARFDGAIGLAIDRAGNAFIADTSNHTIRKITAAGAVTTLAGLAGLRGSVDGTGGSARFRDPAGIARDGAGNVYIADTNNHTIRKITAAGAVTTLAGSGGISGTADGQAAAARFNGPLGVAADSAGNVHVSDTVNSTIRKVSAGVVTTLAGSAGVTGGADGSGAAARFNKPSGAKLDGLGNIYVADTSNHTIRKITAAGAVTTVAGTAGVQGSQDGSGATATFNAPASIALDGNGNIYVADTFNHTIRRLNAAGTVTTLAGTAGVPGSADGAGATARFNFPSGLVTDSAGNLYVADFGNHAIRKVTPTGTVTTIAGTAAAAGIQLGATPRLASPRAVTLVDDSIVITDSNAVLVLRHGAQ